MDSITSGLASSTFGGTKFKIQQSIPSGSVKKGPQAIVRTVDLNDGIEIKRRFGEGSKPLFARDDIAVNKTTVGEKCDASRHDNSTGCKSKTTRRSTSTESSTPERYRHRDNKKHSSPPPGRRKSSERSTREEKHNYNRDKHSRNLTYSATKADKYRRKEKSKSHSPSASKKRTTEKTPYYRDEVRERDRLRRLYGTKERERSRSRSPPSSKHYSPISKRRFDSPKRRHSSSRDRYRRRSPYHGAKRDNRSHRSRTRSRTRSPQRRARDSHKKSSRDRDKERKNDTSIAATTVIPPTPQFIPIPVAVPADYGYQFSGWPGPQPSWPLSQHRPTAPHFAPYPMLPIMPPMRPPHQTPYGAMQPHLHYTQMGGYRSHPPIRYAPPRHGMNNYQPRSKKPSS